MSVTFKPTRDSAPQTKPAEPPAPGSYHEKTGGSREGTETSLLPRTPGRGWFWGTALSAQRVPANAQRSDRVPTVPSPTDASQCPPASPQTDGQTHIAQPMKLSHTHKIIIIIITT